MLIACRVCCVGIVVARLVSQFCWICKAKWTGYSHVCDGFTESNDLKPKAWNDGEDVPTGILLAKPGLEVRTLCPCVGVAVLHVQCRALALP